MGWFVVCLCNDLTSAFSESFLLQLSDLVVQLLDSSFGHFFGMLQNSVPVNCWENGTAARHSMSSISDDCARSNSD
uniref:Putative secreted protein n=1 Tax=Anopheles marajoara TaxID=58244 RepID=A0A2M4CCY0_9DIPT